jgi:hypothetical protein
VLLAAMYALLAGNAALYFTAPLHPLAHVALVRDRDPPGVHDLARGGATGTVSGDPRTNEIVGVLGMLPYMTPFFLQRWLHLEHHRVLNQPDDPNCVYTDGLLSHAAVSLPARARARAPAASVRPAHEPQRLSDTADHPRSCSVIARRGARHRPPRRLRRALVRPDRGREAGDGLVHQLPPAPRPRRATTSAARGFTAIGWLTPLI